jgi:hypothetical protein
VKRSFRVSISLFLIPKENVKRKIKEGKRKIIKKTGNGSIGLPLAF